MQRATHFGWLVAAVAVIGIGIGAWAFLGGRRHVPADNKPLAVADKTKNKADDHAADAGRMGLGGEPQKAVAKAPAVGPENNASEPVGYGSNPPVSVDANPMVKSVAEAVAQKKHPERLSTLIAPKPFDKQAFQGDPTAYLNVVEPARVFQVAQPGPGVPRLRSSSPRLQQITQGDSTKLRVAAPPKSPVTFTSFDLGQFENQLTSMTVQANAAGIAEVQFTATPGTIDDVHILAGCPVAAGQVRFTVNVLLPTTPRPSTSQSTSTSSGQVAQSR